LNQSATASNRTAYGFAGAPDALRSETGACLLNASMPASSKTGLNAKNTKKVTFFTVFSRWIKAYALTIALSTVGKSFFHKTGRS
jgi:hypothetical protein